jgi:hypothetical protein
MRACRVRDLGSNPSQGARDSMSVILKVNKGTAEKLLQWSEIKPDQSRNLSGKELTLEIENSELVIEYRKEDMKRMLEISDLNGSFGVWIELTKDNTNKIKNALK